VDAPFVPPLGESLGTDSRVLRREQPLDAPVTAFSAKKFSCGELRCARFVARAKIPVIALSTEHDRGEIILLNSAETGNLSAFLRCAKICTDNCIGEKIFAATPAQGSLRVRRSLRRSGAYTQN
jgi:hypothetical protein